MARARTLSADRATRSANSVREGTKTLVCGTQRWRLSSGREAEGLAGYWAAQPVCSQLHTHTHAAAVQYYALRAARIDRIHGNVLHPLPTTCAGSACSWILIRTQFDVRDVFYFRPNYLFKEFLLY